MLHKDVKTKSGHPEVDRVRRAHRNDMENIPAYITISFLFMLTLPSETLAVNLFRIAGISRIIHTLVYAIYPKQPHRLLAFFGCYGITIFMCLRILLAYI